jgi:hypothetical protein
MAKALAPKVIQRSRFDLRSLVLIMIFGLIGGYIFVNLSAASGQKGDVNGDGKVDITDLSILLSNYNKTTTYDKGDLDSNGIVNILDLSILLSNYGKVLGIEGRVLFMEGTTSATDVYTNNPTPTTQQWMRDHWDQAVVYSPYWDTRLSWYPNGSPYLDAYAIYLGSDLANQHPDWILKDSNGNKLYIPFACNGTTCTQYAADIGSPAWRQYYIDQMKAYVNLGYKGIYVDDVDMDLNTGNASGTIVAPRDPRTGATMTDTAWKSYFAEFMEQLRTALPNTQIIHNSVWFAGGGNNDASNPYIVRQIKAANLINIERGFTDGGITGGTGTWSLFNYMAYMDKLHSYGDHFIIQSYANTSADMEYNLAGYFLVTDGNDYVYTDGGSNPTNWWSAYDTDLGGATGARYQWNGLWRRDFSNGFVILNEPGASTKTVSLGGTFKNTAGAAVTNATLSASRGAVFLK